MSTMRDDIRRGLNDIWPAAVAAAPIGLLFGAVAASKGLSPFEVFLMSIMVFAGGAQFAAIELWASPAPGWRWPGGSASRHGRRPPSTRSRPPC